MASLLPSERLVRPVVEEADGGRTDEDEGGRPEAVAVVLDRLDGRALPVLVDAT